MKIFDELGSCVDEGWRRKSYDDDALPDVSVRALESFRVDQHVTPEDIIDWYFSDAPSPPQEMNTTFGNPPITVFRNDLFYIDALFWMDGSTLIHQHGFSGAFQVLHGSSIHTIYDFEASQKINWRLVVGDLQMRQSEHLQPGTIRGIQTGSRFIHALFHLDRPSVSLVIRTSAESADPGASPQYGYLKPHFGLPIGRPRRERTPRRQDLIRVAFARDRAGCLARLRQRLQEEDFEAVLRYAITLHDLDVSAAEEFLHEARPRHGDLVDLALVALRERQRENAIKARRRTIHRPDHRFFLAVLLNMSHREAALRLIAECHGSQPVDIVMRWLRELAVSDDEDSSGPLGIHLDADALAAVERRLRGSSWGDWAEVPILRPLLAAEPPPARPTLKTSQPTSGQR